MDLDNRITYLNKLLQQSSNQSASAANDKKYYIYVLSKWKTDGVWFNLLSTKNNKSYTAHVTYRSMQEAARELDIGYELFLEECRKALTTNISFMGFEYDIEEKEAEEAASAAATFKLTKKMDLRILYLDFPLKLSQNNYEILDTAVELAQQLEEATFKEQRSNARNSELEDEKMNLLHRCLQEKNELEKRLLCKFKLLLNSKKQKILDLQNQLELAGLALDDDEEEERAQARRSQADQDQEMAEALGVSHHIIHNDDDDDDDEDDLLDSDLEDNADDDDDAIVEATNGNNPQPPGNPAVNTIANNIPAPVAVEQDLLNFFADAGDSEDALPGPSSSMIDNASSSRVRAHEDDDLPGENPRKRQRLLLSDSDDDDGGVHNGDAAAEADNSTVMQIQYDQDENKENEAAFDIFEIPTEPLTP